MENETTIGTQEATVVEETPVQTEEVVAPTEVVAE